MTPGLEDSALVAWVLGHLGTAVAFLLVPAGLMVARAEIPENMHRLSLGVSVFALVSGAGQLLAAAAPWFPQLSELLAYWAVVVAVLSGITVWRLPLAVQSATSELRHLQHFPQLIDGNAGHWSYDLETKTTILSPGLLKSLGYEETETLTLEALVHPDDYQAALGVLQVASDTGFARWMYRVRHREGRYLWRLNYAVRCMERGKLRGVLGMLTDVHELVEQRDRFEATNADLAHLNKEMEQFVWMCSHDLKEPFRNAESAANILFSDKSSDEMKAEFLPVLFDSLHRGKQLVADFVELGRASADMSTKPIEVHREIARVAERVALSSEYPAGQLTVKVAPEIDHLMLQPKLFDMGLSNLLLNAWKFHPKHGAHIKRVTVHASLGEGTFKLSVTDNGVGIAASELPKVKKLFSRLYSDDQYTGRGLGLAIVDAVAKKHGGTLTVSSPGAGGGTTVTIEVPL